MKLFFNLSILFFFVGVLNAQTNKQQSNSSTKGTVVTDVKANFIETQQYLNTASSFKNYVYFYNDSLNGFDEAEYKAMLLGRSFYGAEFIYVMNNLKHEFIIKKYHLNTSLSNQQAFKPIGGSSVNAAPCVNEDFEATAPGQYTGAGGVVGWTISNSNNGFPNGAACVTPTTGAAGSPELWVMTTPIADPYLGTLPNSPLGGSKVIKMNNSTPGTLVTQIRQTFPVTAANSLYQFAYAGAWDGSGHACCDQPSFKVDVFNCANVPLPCSSISLTPSGSGCTSGVAGYSVTVSGISWTNWTVKYIDLTPYIGTCVTIRVTNSDCNGGAHFGYAFFDSKCGGNIIGSGLGGAGGNVAGPVSFCAGSSAAGIVAPLGYASYQWTGPAGVSYTPALANAPSITVSPVTVGQVFTVTMVSASGCTFTAKDTIKTSSAYINGIATQSTCPGGASGSATVYASGSSSGYTFSYTCISNPTVNLSSQTTATVINLTPGTYSATVVGGGGTCGTASGTFQIGTSPPNLFFLTKPYCGNKAYLTTVGGSNFQWYNNLTPIPAPQGTAQNYTVNTPFNGAVYYLSYTTPQGCKDSVKYTLQSTTPGAVSVPSIGLICTGATNGTAAIVIMPAASTPSGLNTYSVFSSPTPSYSSVLAPTVSNTFVPTGLSAGTYSVAAFDGSCYYGTTFTVNPYTFNYTVSPVTSTICQGNNITASVNFGNQIIGTPCSNIGVGPACLSPNVIQVGTTTSQNGTTSYPAPYGNWYKNARHQLLFRASELTAMGIGQGYLTSLAFNVITISGTTSYPGYTIRLKCTGVSALPNTFDNTGLTQVYSSNYIVTTGWNTHNFTTPYYWDGVSNLLVDVCYNLTPSYTQNSTSPYFTTAFASCLIYYSDTQPACLTTQTPFGTTNNRPVVRFGNCAGTNPSQFTYSWTPATFLSSTTTTASIVTPTTAPGTMLSTNYSVVVTPTFINCPVTKTFTVTVANPVTPTITPINPFCTNASAVTITVNPSGGTFSTNVAVGLINATTGLITPSLAAISTNTFMYSVGVGSCIATASGSFNVSQYNPSTLTSSIAPICVTNANVNLMSLVQSTVNGVWTGVNVTGTYSFNPSGLATNTYVLTYSTTSSPNPTVCPSSNTLAVSVTSTISPVITPLPVYCSNNAPVNMTVSPIGGSWFGNAAVSLGGVVSPNLAPIGASTVNYSITVGPCVNTASTTITTNQYNPATLTGSVGNQCTTMPLVNLNSIVQSTVNGVWSGVNVIGTYSFNPAGLATNTYVLTYNTTSSPNPTLCPDSHSLTVDVLNPIVPNITQVGPYCNTSPATQLVVTPNTGAWVTSSYLSNTGMFTPALANIGQNFVQYIVGTATCNAQQTKTINIEAFVPAVITGSIANKCNNNSAINLLPLTTNALGTWSGLGVTGFNFNPSTSGVGSIVLTYNTASSPSGLCPDQASLSVNVFSLAPANITQVGPFCNTAPPIQLNVSPLGGSFGATNNAFAINTAGLFLPSFANIGSNIINYTTTSGPCVSIATTTINIEQYISADFTNYAGPYCRNNPIINLNSLVQNSGGVWSGANVVNGLFNPATANSGNNNLVIYQTHSMPTASLCPDTAAMRITVNDIPSVTAVSNVNKGCLPVEVIFNTPSANTGNGTWDFGDGQTGTGLVITHIYTTAGSYSVVFNYQDQIGCATQAILPTAINVYAVPHAGFVFNPNEDITIANPEVQFNNLSSVLGDNTYQWQIGTLYQLSDVNPKVIFPQVGEYLVTLTAITTNGCKDQVSKIVSVKNDYGVYIPNSFSPNFDGLNDVFIPVFSPFGLDLKTAYEFEVFDRWGHSLFHTKDFTKGWDGTIQNRGEDPLKQEVYVYKIKYKDLDGKINHKTGHVSLIK